MTTLFVLIWLATLIAILYWGIKLIKFKIEEKKNKGLNGIKLKLKNIFKTKDKQINETKFTYQQLKTFLIISVVVSLISFIGIGITVTPEETNNTTITESKNNEPNDVKENNIDQVESENKQEDDKTESNDKQDTIIDFTEIKQQSLSNIPEYSNSPYFVINNNVPFFNDIDLTTNSYESYSELDDLGRCSVAVACVGKDIMPTEERGNIGNVKPTGWHSAKYQGIDGNYLYNRCHLIGYQLTGENTNEKNLITGTRYMNVEGMLPFENMVADYVKETENHVLYRVTPVFIGINLLASGVLIEAKSVEDEGREIQFNVYCYNVQPGIEINYATGDSSGPEFKGTTNTSTSNSSNSTSSSSSTTNNNTNTTSTNSNTTSESTSSNNTSSSSISNNSSSGATTNNKTEIPTSNNTSQTYTLNTNTKKFHRPSCGSAARISEKNKSSYTGSREDLIAQGYSPCGNCDP